MGDAEHKKKKGKNMSETSPENTPRKKQGMFDHPFSSDGRINRTEFALSVLIYFVINIALSLLLNGSIAGIILELVTMFFILVQGAKRCHDIGKNGAWILVPFFWVYLLFKEGDEGENGYERYE